MQKGDHCDAVLNLSKELIVFSRHTQECQRDKVNQPPALCRTRFKEGMAANIHHTTSE